MRKRTGKTLSWRDSAASILGRVGLPKIMSANVDSLDPKAQSPENSDVEIPEAMESGISGFMDWMRYERGLSEHTVVNYGSDLRQCAAVLVSKGITSWKGVSTQDLLEWTHRMGQSDLTNRSIARKHSALRSFSRYLRHEGVRTDEMSAALKRPRAPRRLPHSLSIENMLRLLEAPPMHTPIGVRDRAILELTYSSGLRVSELCGLRATAVSFEEGLVKVYGKGAKERICPVGQPALKALRDYLAVGRPALVKPRTGGELFLSRLGKAISRKTVWHLIHQYAAALDLPGPVTPHTLRHSFATHLLHGGADLRVIQEMLGHADISTTQIYTEVDASRKFDEHATFHPRQHLKGGDDSKGGR